MEYFLSHLPYIIVAGVCIAAVAVIWAVVSNAAADSKDADEKLEKLSAEVLSIVNMIK